MNATVAVPWLKALNRTGLGAPLLLMMMLAMVVLPLPPLALDVFFTFNISLSLIVLLAVVYVARPLELGVFPTVLLGATLLRLALNVASTRVVLLEGHTGTGAAGRVIEAFGEFVVGGNYAVGIVVFAILVIINFVVVTKGAGRVSEVSARFTLDAMPGKQMAIDADLNAGIITQDEARTRREEVRMEADFYGSMDGASKFVRGDAVAGILILFINIIGGLSVGTAQHDMAFGDAMRTYTLLTIGDGLVAQIPSLLLSTAVAIIVTRMSMAQDMGEQVVSQLLAEPKVLAVTGGILGILGLVPGMPNLVFLSLGALCGGGAWLLHQKTQAAAEPEAPAAASEEVPEERRELSWDDVSPVDVVGLEVGYRLIPLVDQAQGGQLMARIKGVRKKLSEDLGFLVQPVHIRDNLDLAPEAYRISLMGVPVGEGEVQSERELAINPGQVMGKVRGIETRDPAFGLPAVWIDAGTREHAQSLGYTVVDPATVVATHLSHILQSHASELLGHEEAQELLDRLGRGAPKLVEELVPKTLPLSVFVKVLQELLAEGVPIRNLRGIAEALAEHGARTQDADALVVAVRQSLARTIAQQVGGIHEEIPVITLDPRLERILHDATQGDGANVPGIEPSLAEQLFKALGETVQRQEIAGEPSVLLVSPSLRAWLSRLVRPAVPALSVLAFNEVPDNRKLRIVATVGGNELPGPGAATAG